MSALSEEITEPGEAAESQIRRRIPAPTKPDVKEAKELTFEEFQQGLNATFEHAGPLLKHVMNFIDFVAPLVREYAAKASEMIALIPDGLVLTIYGVLLCFFGGTFCFTVAAIEAFYMFGFETTKKNLMDLWEELAHIKLAIQLEETKPADSGKKNDKGGKAEKGSKHSEYVILKTDPNKMSMALAGLASSFAAVIATLQSNFAKILTLSNSISNELFVPVKRHSTPLLVQVVPEDYQKWIDPALTWLLKGVTVTVSYFLSKIISAVHSAIRGGLLAARSALLFAKSKGFLEEDFDLEKTYLDEFIGGALAFIGIVWQISYAFGVPFPMNIILFPITLVEHFLFYWVVK